MTGSGAESGIGSAWFAGAARESPWRQPPMLLATLSIVVLAVLVVVTFGATRAVERQAAERSSRLAYNAVAELQRRDGKLALDYAWWTETFVRLRGPRPDLDWIDDNIGRWLTAQFGVTGSFVATGEGGWVYGSLHGERLESGAAAALLGAAGEGLARRAAEAPFDAPAPVGAFLPTDGEIALATAVAVSPEDSGIWALAGGERSVLLLLRAFDEELLAHLSDLYGLEDLHLRAEPATHSVPLAVEGQDPVAWLAWRAPGYSAGSLVTLVQPAAAGLLLLLAASAMLAWRAQQGQQRRAERERAERNRKCPRPGGLPSVFLANVSHELRTPLNAILGFSEILRDQQAGAAGQYRQYAADIHASGRRLLTMIDDIVELSRIQAGLVQARPGGVALGSLLRRLKTTLAEERPAEASRLRFETSQAEVFAAVDPELALQLLRRLVEHCLDEGTGPVTAGLLAQDEGTLRIRLGESRLSPESARRSFEPFGSGENPLVSAGGGGVDLALAHALATLVGGHLEVEEGREGGSFFLLELPAGSAAGKSRTPGGPATASTLERPAALS